MEQHNVIRRPMKRATAWRWMQKSVAGALAASLTLSLFSPMTVRAQSAVYSPSGTQGAYSGANGAESGAAGYAAQGAGQTSAVPLGAATAQSLSPTTISAPNSTQAADGAATQVMTPTAGPMPLYARPTATPGEFELFTRPPPLPSEFEEFVAKTLGHPLTRFGSSLVTGGTKGFATPPTTSVPPDYRLNPGDELVIGVTGSVEASLRLVIDSEGRIFIPKLGSINVAGMRYGDLADALSRRFSEQYKQATLSVSIGHLHGLTVYVTGYAVSPGAYTVSSLATMVDAVLAAGGPTAGGSFRRIELRRNGQVVTDLDLYDLLLKGDKTHDAVLQNNDVLNIAPAGPELAVTGSVNAEAIYEARPGETLADVIRFAGGLNSLADETRLIVSRLGDLDLAGSQTLSFAQARTFPAERGTIIDILSLGNITRPQERQAILATIDGEVDHPGRYYMAPGSTLQDLLAKAGGLTGGAYVFGTNYLRDSVRRQQQVSFDRAISDLELSAAAAPLSELSGLEAATAGPRLQASLAVIDRLKERKPDGRLILDLTYGTSALPGALALEDNDRIYIPPRPKTVGVFGAVFEPGSFLFNSPTKVSDYLKLAGGPQKIADRGQIFVVRANGSVISTQQTHDLGNQPALPGDVVFVPVRTGASFWDKLRDISTVVFQFGISAATLAILARN
jgi:polysaccharide export outer membrane protein